MSALQNVSLKKWGQTKGCKKRVSNTPGRNLVETQDLSSRCFFFLFRISAGRIPLSTITHDSPMKKHQTGKVAITNEPHASTLNLQLHSNLRFDIKPLPILHRRIL